MRQEKLIAKECPGSGLVNRTISTVLTGCLLRQHMTSGEPHERKWRLFRAPDRLQAADLLWSQ